MAEASLPATYFEALYAADPVPWRFASSDYERDKYAATLAVLPKPRFASGLEVGCSIGVLTAQLAQRCDALLAIDVVGSVLDAARARCEGLAVRFAQARIPSEWPAGRYDLIVLSEVLYYLSEQDLAAAADAVVANIADDGAVILVHFTEPTNYPLSGDAAASGFVRLTQRRLSRVRTERAPRYRLDVLRA